MKQIRDLLVLHSIPERKPDSHKGDYGRVLVIGGNKQMGGAAILCASAAVYSGAGLVTVATDPSNKPSLLTRLPEAMTIDMYDTEALKQLMETMDVVVIGPGLGTSDTEWTVMETVLDTIQPHQHLVIDGDGISLFAEHKVSVPDASVVFTPHPGEWKRLSGLSPEEENQEKNTEARDELGAAVVLKKNRTEIYFKDDVWQNTTTMWKTPPCSDTLWKTPIQRAFSATSTLGRPAAVNTEPDLTCHTLSSSDPRMESSVT